MRIRHNGRRAVTASTSIQFSEVVKVLQDKIDEAYAVLQDRYGISFGDIAPEQFLKQDELTDELAELITEVLNTNM